MKLRQNSRALFSHLKLDICPQETLTGIEMSMPHVSVDIQMSIRWWKKKKNLENAFNLCFCGTHLASFLVVLCMYSFCYGTETGCWLEKKVKDGTHRITATGDNPPVSNCLTGSHGESSKERGRQSKKHRDEPEEALRGKLAYRQEFVASWNLYQLQFYFSNPVF